MMLLISLACILASIGIGKSLDHTTNDIPKLLTILGLIVLSVVFVIF